MAMRLKRYGDERITTYWATIDATGCRHRVSIRPILPRRTPWSSISAYKIELWQCGDRFPMLAFKRHKRTEPSTQLIEATSCLEKSNATAEELS
jgi:hypothetical protein